jgi:hypothetical protein
MERIHDNGNERSKASCDRNTVVMATLWLFSFVTLFFLGRVPADSYLYGDENHRTSPIDVLMGGGRIAQSVQELDVGWTVRGLNPGGCDTFRTRPDRPWGPASMLCGGRRVSLPG